MKRIKISVFGAGGTGVKTAEAVCARGNVDVVLIDVLGDVARGRALDIQQTQALTGKDFSVLGGSDIQLCEHSDIVVITAGQGRKPGTSREQLMDVNARIVAGIARQSARLSPQAFLIVLTNPADLLARVAMEASGFAAHRVMGQGGVLDSARMSVLVAQKLGVSVHDVRSLVLGGHGDSMVPVRDFVSVHGVPASLLLNHEDWLEIVRRTRYGGGEILQYFGNHGAAATPGLAVVEMIDALLSVTPRLLPVSTQAHGEYGIRDVFIGLPARVSERGVETVVQLPLAADDLAALRHSAQVLTKSWTDFMTNRDTGG